MCFSLIERLHGQLVYLPVRSVIVIVAACNEIGNVTLVELPNNDNIAEKRSVPSGLSSSMILMD